MPDAEELGFRVSVWGSIPGSVIWGPGISQAVVIEKLYISKIGGESGAAPGNQSVVAGARRR
jgi:hypothetical protein